MKKCWNPLVRLGVSHEEDIRAFEAMPGFEVCFLSLRENSKFVGDAKMNGDHLVCAGREQPQNIPPREFRICDHKSGFPDGVPDHCVSVHPLCSREELRESHMNQIVDCHH